MKKLFFSFLVVLIGVFFFNCLIVEAEIYKGGGLSSTDKWVINKNDKKIISPGGNYNWLNSWPVIRKQPIEFKRKIFPPYTLEYSFRTEWFEETIWLEYSYMIWKKPLHDYNDREIEKIEKWIFKFFKYAATVRYIEKKAANFSIIVYRRNNQKKRDIPKISGYPLFNFENIFVGHKRIEVEFKKFLDPWGRKIEEPLKIPMKDVFLLNPALIYEPSEMEEVHIPYSFFRDKFIYEHPKIKIFAYERGDPMIIELKDNGIIVKFRKR
ncbi:hypothetical protein KAI52_03925 [Candidatus Parcubacteria bacterium]|nr:hypothetical protein [Candidatus Parcubacteria bacterium]